MSEPDTPEPQDHPAVTSSGLRWVTLAELQAMHPVRPNPLRWLGYAFGAGLPERHREWVLHDATCSTWILRHVVRTMLMLVLPVAAVVVFLPTSLGLRILTAFTAGACGFMFALVHIIETTERRVVRAGYVGGTAERLRGARSVEEQRAGNARRRERAEQRRRSRIERHGGHRPAATPPAAVDPASGEPASGDPASGDPSSGETSGTERPGDDSADGAPGTHSA